MNRERTSDECFEPFYGFKYIILLFVKVLFKLLLIILVLVMLVIVLVVLDIWLTRNACEQYHNEYGVVYKEGRFEIYSQGCVELTIEWIKITKVDSFDKEVVLEVIENKHIKLLNDVYYVSIDSVLHGKRVNSIGFWLDGYICARGGLGVWPLNCSYYTCIGRANPLIDSVKVLCRTELRTDV